MDKLGNRTQVVFSNPSGSESYGVNDVTNRYDDDTGSPDVVLGYDLAGNQTSDHRSYEYEYDYENRLVKVTADSGATVLAEYVYDALGRRIQTDIDRMQRQLLISHPTFRRLTTQAI